MDAAGNGDLGSAGPFTPIGIPLASTIGASPRVVVLLLGAIAFEDGVEMNLEVCALSRHREDSRDGATDPLGSARLAFEYSDGRRGIWDPFDRHAGPVRITNLGSSGRAARSTARLFLSPVPPPGEVTVYFDWPAMGVPKTRTALTLIDTTSTPAALTGTGALDERDRSDHALGRTGETDAWEQAKQLVVQRVVPLIRVDFSSDDAWRVIADAVRAQGLLSSVDDVDEPDGAGEASQGHARLPVLDAPDLSASDVSTFRRRAQQRGLRSGQVLLADAQSVREARAHEMVTVALVQIGTDDDRGAAHADDVLRVRAADATEIASNLLDGNLSFDDYAGLAGDDGVLRLGD